MATIIQEWLWSLIAITMMITLLNGASGQEVSIAPSKVTAGVGDNAEFKCLATKVGGYMITWTKEDEQGNGLFQINPSTQPDKFELDTLPSNGNAVSSVLRIKDVVTDDRGKYICNYGNSRSVAVLDVTYDEYDVQLVSSDGSNLQGRVEVFVGRVWQRVCQNWWDFADATVVCRQLGFAMALPSTSQASFGQGSGPVMIDRVECQGTEDTLGDCKLRTDEYCTQNEDASVTCSVDDPAYEFGQVRLYGGSSEYDGRVEVYYNQMWGTVCGKEWNQHNADVVCKELGFHHATSWSYDDFLDRVPVWLNVVRCSGKEDRLVHCNHDGWERNNCRQNSEVRVRCNGSPQTLSIAAIVGIVCGAILGVVLLVVICKLYFCRKSKRTSTTTGATATTYSQVAADGSNVGPPVIHYTAGQQTQDLPPSVPSLPPGEDPPPPYDAVLAQPTMLPKENETKAELHSSTGH